MSIKNVQLNKKAGELIITVAAEVQVWKEAQDKGLKKLVADVEVKGFRKGQAPVDVAKRNLTNRQIYDESLKVILEELAKEAAKEIKPEMEVIDSPTYRIEEIDDENLTISFLYPTYPEFEITNYKNLEGLKFEVRDLKEEDIDNEIQKLVDMHTKWEPKDGKLASGDKAIFDFEGFINNKPFEGGKALKYELVIGSNHFIEGFEDQMIGLAKKELRDVNVTFPENYQVDLLKGKDAVFKVKLHEIHVQSIPKVDDEFVKKLGLQKVHKADDLRPHVRNILTEALKAEAKLRFQQAAFDLIRKDLKVVIHNNLIYKEEERLIKDFQERLQKQGMTIQKYQKDYNMSDAQLHTQFLANAEKSLKDTFIYAEISKLENIVLGEEDFEKEYKRLATLYGAEVDAVKTIIPKENLRTAVTNEKVIDRLIELNNKAGKNTSDSNAKTKEIKKEDLGKTGEVKTKDLGKTKETKVK